MSTPDSPLAPGRTVRRVAVGVAATLFAFGALTVGLVLALAGDDGGDPPDVDDLAIVGVRAGGCSLVDSLGSGVAVDEARVLTAAHVVAGTTDIRLVLGEVEVPGIIDVLDPELDLAVIRPATPLDVAPTPVARAPVASGVWLGTWDPDEGSLLRRAEVSRRLLVTIEDIYLDGRYQRGAIEVDIGVEHGVSGAGVFDADGRVAGIVYASSRSREATFALDAPELEGVLARADGEPSDGGRCR